MKFLLFSISCIVLASCEQKTQLAPTSKNEIPSPNFTGDKNESTPHSVQIQDNIIPVDVKVPESADPVWNKILAGGLNAQKFSLLRDRVGQMVNAGNSSEAWISINSLPLGVIRDELAADYFRTIPTDSLIHFLNGSTPITPEDEKTLSRSIPMRSTSPNDVPVDFASLASVTQSQSLKDDLLARASFKIETAAEWEAIATKGLSEQGLIKAANNAFAKLRQSDPAYLKSLSTNPQTPEGVKQEAAKAFSLLLLESSPEQAVKFIEEVGSIPAADVAYQTWLKQDPAAATSWMKTKTGSKFYRTLIMRTISYAEANNEKETAKAWMDVLLSLGPPK